MNMEPTVKTIVDHSIEYAHELLQETKQCYPFGAFVDRKGQVHPLEFDLEGAKSTPDNETVRTSLKKYCLEEFELGRIIAWGLTYEASVQLKEEEDAIETIAIEIYSIENDNLPIYYYPYEFKEETVVFGDPFAVVR